MESYNTYITNERMPIGQKVFIYFYLLHNLRFFNLKLYHQSLGEYLVLIDALFCIYFLYIFISTRRQNGDKLLYGAFSALYLIGIASIFVGNIVNGQSIYYGFRGIVFTYMNLGFFYYLIHIKASIKEMTRTCWVLGGLYALTMTLSYLQYPHCWFGFKPSIENFEEAMEHSLETRGMYRFEILGADYLSMAFFFILSSKKKNKSFWTIFAIILVFQLLRGARFPFVATCVMGFVAYLYKSNLKLKHILLLGIISIGTYGLLMNVSSTKRIIESYTEMTINQVESNEAEDDIRLLALSYFFLEYNDNVAAKIIGNGVPVRGSYADKLSQINTVAHLYQNDIEYIQWYLYFGVLGLFVLFLLGYSCMKIPIDEEGAYLKIFIAYIFLVMCLGSHFYREIPHMSTVVYLLFVYNLKYKEQKTLIEN